jgi:hypothetical protein
VKDTSSVNKAKPFQRRLCDLRSYLRSKEEALDRYEGLPVVWQFLVFGLVMVALFSRCPSMFTHAQLYAEDGAVWYAQAYNNGWLHSLIVPQAGYLQTLPRLGAGLALLFPLRYAPLVMAITGMLIQSLPATILLSARCRNWAPLTTRVLLAAIYIGVPNSREVHIVLTNTQWHLALAEALLAFASTPRSWSGRLFDVVIFLVGGFSGPFCIVLAPLVLVFWWVRRQRWSLVIFAVMSVGVFTQIVLLTHTTARIQGALGAKLETFLRMVGGNIVASAMFGGHSFAVMVPTTLLVLTALGGLSVYLYCFGIAHLELKLFLVYCAALLAASLHNPLVTVGRAEEPLWDSLVRIPSCRYWYFPTLAFMWGAVWCALYGRARLFKLAGTCIVLLMSIGIGGDWVYRRYPDKKFPVYVQQMQNAKPGAHVIIPIVPTGWHMDLVKKSA